MHWITLGQHWLAKAGPLRHFSNFLRVCGESSLGICLRGERRREVPLAHRMSAADPPGQSGVCGRVKGHCQGGTWVPCPTHTFLFPRLSLPPTS